MKADVHSIVRFSVDYPDSKTALFTSVGHPLAMLAEIYTEALRAKEDLANQVLTLLVSGQIDTDTAIFEWVMIPIRERVLDTRRVRSSCGTNPNLQSGRYELDSVS